MAIYVYIWLHKVKNMDRKIIKIWLNSKKFTSYRRCIHTYKEPYRCKVAVDKYSNTM